MSFLAKIAPIYSIVDFLLALKGDEDSFCKTAMSRREDEDCV
jgi:hypothetical protein